MITSLKSFLENKENKTFYARKSNHIESDIKRNWSSFNFGALGFEGTKDELDKYISEIDEDNPIHISGIEIFPDFLSDYTIKELYNNYWVVVDTFNAPNGLSGIELDATNLNDAIKEALSRSDYFGDGDYFDANKAKLVFSKNDIHIFELME